MRHMRHIVAERQGIQTAKEFNKFWEIQQNKQS